MRIFKIDRNNPDRRAIKSAARVIKSKGVVIYPTDTIYGLGANALDKRTVKKIFKIKKRPEVKAVSVVVKDVKMAKKYCRVNKIQQEIFSALLPGPFTLILPKKANAKIFAGDKKTLAIRIPDSRVTQALADYLKIPFTATSANISGLSGSGDIKKVLKQLGINRKKPNLSANRRISLVLDAGNLPKRKPSIIIDLTKPTPKIIRK